jgi:hypothetical protein
MTSGSERSPASPTRIVSRRVVRHNDPAGNQVNLRLVLRYHNQSSRRQYPGMTMPDRDSKPATIKTILVLDDDVLVRKPVVQLLRECGYRVPHHGHAGGCRGVSDGDPQLADTLC